MMKRRADAWYRKLAALALIVAAVGIPINLILDYGLLVVAAVLIFTGSVTVRLRAWLLALCVAAATIGGKWLAAPPAIEEGHNVFLGEHAEALQADLPGDVFAFMAQEFDAQYPLARRATSSAPRSTWWRSSMAARRAITFSPGSSPCWWWLSGASRWPRPGSPGASRSWQSASARARRS
jgi:hypothetical protein